MHYNIKYFLFSLIMLFPFSCTRKQSDYLAFTPDFTPTVKNDKLLIVDLDNAKKEKICNLSSFFKSASALFLITRMKKRFWEVLINSLLTKTDYMCWIRILPKVCLRLIEREHLLRK